MLWRMKQYILAILLLFVLNAHSAGGNNDTIKTLAQAKEFFNNNLARPEDYQHTIQALEVIISSDEADNIPHYGAKALSRYAWMLSGIHGQDLALPMFRQALEYCPPGDSVLYYDILAGMGGIHLRQRDYKEAEDIINRSLAYHVREKDTLGMVKDYYNIACLMNRMDKRSAAVANAQKALSLAMNGPHKEYESQILYFLADHEDDFHKKDRLLMKADSITYKYNFNELEIHSLMRQAWSKVSQGKYQEALTLADKCMASAKRYDMHEVETDVLELKAKILGKLKDYPQAYFTLSLAAEKDDARHAHEYEKLTEYGKYSRLLLDWCEQNIIKRNGHYVPRKKASTNTILMIAGVAAILLAVSANMLRRFSLINKRRMELEREENERKIESLESKSKAMGESIFYLLHFYNNHNVLLEKIRTMARHGLAKETEQASALRKIGNFASSNMLDKIDNEHSKDQEEEYSRFVSRLESSFPDITEAEKKMAVYLKAGLTTREICVLTGNQPRSVNMTRYRLRKSLQLGESDNLENYLKSF